MTDPITARLDRVRELADAASSTPWSRYSVDFRGYRSHSVKTGTGAVIAHCGYGPDGGTAHSDAEFIASSRTDVVWMEAALQNVMELADTLDADAEASLDDVSFAVESTPEHVIASLHREARQAKRTATCIRQAVQDAMGSPG